MSVCRQTEVYHECLNMYLILSTEEVEWLLYKRGSALGKYGEILHNSSPFLRVSYGEHVT